jgi:thiamine kinase-like enzyme
VRYSDKIVHQKYLKNYERLNVERLRGDLDSLQGILEQQTESPIVFCHNDLLSANIIYQHSLMMNDGLARIDDADNLPDSSTLNISTEAIDSSSKSFGKSSPLSARVSDTSAADSEDVVFIDYEYGAYMNRGFDIGNHFNEYAGFDCDYSKYPASKHQLEWLEIYLTEWNGGRRPSGQEINEIYREVNKFALVSHFFWAVWAMVQASVSDIEFDYLGYAILRFAEYDRRREEFLAL